MAEAANPYVNSYVIPYATSGVPLLSRVAASVQVIPPRGEWSGQAEWMRFARLIDRPVRVLGGPAVRAAFGGNLSLTWLPRRVGGGLRPAANLALDRRGQGCCGDLDREESTWQPTAGIRQRPTGCCSCCSASSASWRPAAETMPARPPPPRPPPRAPRPPLPRTPFRAARPKNSSTTTGGGHWPSPGRR